MLNRVELADELERLSNLTFDKSREEVIEDLVGLIANISDEYDGSNSVISVESEFKSTAEIYRESVFNNGNMNGYRVSVDLTNQDESAVVYFEGPPEKAIELAVGIIRVATNVKEENSRFNS